VETEEVSIEIRSDPRLLRSVRSLVRSYLEDLKLSGDRCDEVVLAVDEACANSMRHSYGGRDDGTLRLTLGQQDDHVVIVLSDQGEPIPAACLARKELAAPDPDTVAPGGLGVLLIYRVFDEVDYVPGDAQGNRVTMRLRCPQSDSAT